MPDRLRTNKAVLEYLRLMHAHWARNQDTFGDTYNVAIVRLALVGWMETRPADISSLAASTYISRQQAARRCLKLERQGWLILKREQTHTYVLPTAKLITLTAEMIPNKMVFVVARVRKIALAMMAAGMIATSCGLDADPSTPSVDLATDAVPIVVSQVVRQVAGKVATPVV